MLNVLCPIICDSATALSTRHKALGRKLCTHRRQSSDACFPGWSLPVLSTYVNHSPHCLFAPCLQGQVAAWVATTRRQGVSESCLKEKACLQLRTFLNEIMSMMF